MGPVFATCPNGRTFLGSEGTVGFIVIEPPIGVSIGMTTVATEPAMKGEVGIVKECFAFLSQTLEQFWPESDGASETLISGSMLMVEMLPLPRFATKAVRETGS